MAPASSITVEQSGAFVETFSLPPTADGPLAGLRFAAKDIMDIAGRRTGCGNPTWRDTHPPADVHAVCVEQLLAAGAECVGKTLTDELAFSLIGENHFCGTPLNPAAPDRVPGGSSSGSASAVACGLADFALGTDTGGSVRMPASNCGIWGLRPSHGFVSVAGVMPFAPTFDTVGILAKSGAVLARAASVLLATEPAADAAEPTIHLLDEAFELVDPEVGQALKRVVAGLRGLFGDRVRTISLDKIFAGGAGRDFDTWRNICCILQWSEIRSCLGAWIAKERPQFGPATTNSFKLVDGLDRTTVREVIGRREAYCRALWPALLGPRDLLCIPTVPSPAPLKSSNAQDRTGGYYRRALSLTALAGVGRLPEPLPLAATPASPIGLSLIGAFGEDMFLLQTADAIGGSMGAASF